jgi:hypothetical protein
MNIFDNMKQTIVGHSVAAASASNVPTGEPIDPTAAQPLGTLTGKQIVSVLSSMAANNSQKLYWQTSIVDLMKLLGIDPSLSNLQQLAQGLAYKGDTSDSATMNVWLHREVMRKLTQGDG